MNFLNKIKSAFGASESKRPDSGQPPASAYVDWLPRYMLRNSQTNLRIDTNRPLPGAEDTDTSKAPPCLPEAGVVINRLKVLCGLNPFSLPEPTEGHYEKRLANHRLVFTIRFDDRQDRSICELNLSVRA